MHKPLFDLYDETECIEKLKDELTESLNSKQSVTLQLYASEDEATESQWHTLSEFTDYLAYHLNDDGLSTVERTINLPKSGGKKAKKDEGAVKKLDSTYKLTSANAIPLIRNRLNKAALTLIQRLKISSSKQVSNWKDCAKNTVLKYLSETRVWIIRIEQSNWQSFSSDQLKKEFQLLKKEYPNDKFVIVSPSLIDLGSNIPSQKVSIGEEDLQQLLEKAQPFAEKAIGSHHYETLLCRADNSLLRLDDFLRTCSRAHSCRTALQYLSKDKNVSGKKGKEYQKEHGDSIKRLCKNGEFSE